MKKEEKTKITKNKILSFAMEEFGSGGYHGASLNNICGKGIPKGLLYHNYENKDALYLACVRQCYADLLFLFEEGAPMDNLDAYIAVRLKFVEEYPLKAHLIFESMVQPPENLCAEIRKAHKELERVFRLFDLDKAAAGFHNTHGKKQTGTNLSNFYIVGEQVETHPFRQCIYRMLGSTIYIPIGVNLFSCNGSYVDNMPSFSRNHTLGNTLGDI